MPYIHIKDKKSGSIDLFYEDYGAGRPIVLIHGWPLSHRAWEPQIEHLVQAGYRVIAYDRRGFGHSSKPFTGYDYNTLAADLHSVIEQLGLEKAVIAGFSMGGGEVARYIGNYGTAKLAGAMLISSVTPYMQHAESNPDGVDPAIFEGMRANVDTDRFAFITAWAKYFTSYDTNKDSISDAFLQYLWHLSLAASPVAMKGCITAFGETDFREDLAKFDIPTLVVHGDDDKICPLDVCAERTSALIPQVQLEILADAPHGLNVTHKKELNNVMCEFLADLD